MVQERMAASALRVPRYLAPVQRKIGVSGNRDAGIHLAMPRFVPESHRSCRQRPPAPGAKRARRRWRSSDTLGRGRRHHRLRNAATRRHRRRGRHRDRRGRKWSCCGRRRPQAGRFPRGGGIRRLSGLDGLEENQLAGEMLGGSEIGFRDALINDDAGDAHLSRPRRDHAPRSQGARRDAPIPRRGLRQRRQPHARLGAPRPNGSRAGTRSRGRGRGGRPRRRRVHERSYRKQQPGNPWTGRGGRKP